MKIREDYYRCVKGKFFFIRQKVCFINILLAFTQFNVDILYSISNIFYIKMLKHILAEKLNCRWDDLLWSKHFLLFKVV